jgi:hypothetical protein
MRTITSKSSKQAHDEEAEANPEYGVLTESGIICIVQRDLGDISGIA